MAAETLLLDLDGTVWDSRAWYAHAIAGLSGARVSDIVARLDAGESVPSVSRDCGVQSRHLAQNGERSGSSMVLYDGVIETLDCLRSRGTLIGVVSNLTGGLARPLLESTGIGVYATATVTPGGKCMRNRNHMV